MFSGCVSFTPVVCLLKYAYIWEYSATGCFLCNREFPVLMESGNGVSTSKLRNMGAEKVRSNDSSQSSDCRASERPCLKE